MIGGGIQKFAGQIENQPLIELADIQLVNRIARAHGLQRSGRIITERVMYLAKHHFHVRPDPVGGTFVWRDKDSPATWSTYRPANSEESARKVEEIIETGRLVDVVMARLGLLDEVAGYAPNAISLHRCNRLNRITLT